MDIFDIIKEDHEKVRDLIEKMIEESAPEKRNRSRNMSTLKDLILPHIYAEENLFYPVIMEETDGKDLVLEALEEHRAAKGVLSDVEAAEKDDDQFRANLQVLDDLLEHHIDEEEGEIFDKAEEVIDGDRADEMGVRFQEIKKQSKVEAR